MPEAQGNFARYSSYYDLLYADKDYEREARYIADLIWKRRPQARSILELGCGTGRHGRLLAGLGFGVHGIEGSPEMAAIAQDQQPSVPASHGFFRCEVGDLRSLELRRKFDAVIALFHVMSYQTTNNDLESAFAVAAKHLSPDGVFIFDVWHGPAVLAQMPERRVKEVKDERHRVKRTATPALDSHRSTVTVRYDMECEDLLTGDIARFSEEHEMRYLFPTEIELLARQSRLHPVASEEFLTGKPPSPETWSVLHVLEQRF